MTLLVVYRNNEKVYRQCPFSMVWCGVVWCGVVWCSVGCMIKKCFHRLQAIGVTGQVRDGPYKVVSQVE